MAGRVAASMRGMVRSFSVACVVVALLAAARPVLAAGSSRAGFALRQHSEGGTFDEYPFGDDLSYTVAYEWEENQAFWQLAVDYAPSVDTTNATDYVITPQVTLMLKDKAWRGGLGVLKSLVSDKEEGNDWTDLYWQWALGLQLPILGINFDVTAYYIFESFSDLSDFESDNIEYAVWFKYAF